MYTVALYTLPGGAKVHASSLTSNTASKSARFGTLRFIVELCFVDAKMQTSSDYSYLWEEKLELYCENAWRFSTKRF